MDNFNKPIDFEGVKSQFNKPGGFFAKITALCAIGGIGYGLYKALPYLIAFTTNILILVGEVIALCAIGAVLLNKDTWKFVSLFWLQLTRKIYGWFVKIDPISILEQTIVKSKKKLAIVNDCAIKFDAVLLKMREKLNQYNQELQASIKHFEFRKRELEEYKRAQEKGATIDNNKMLEIKMSMETYANNVIELQNMIKEQEGSIKTSEKYQAVIKDLKIISEQFIKRSEMKLGHQKDRYEQSKVASSLIGSVKSMMYGDKSLAEEMAIEHVTNTINTTMAEMESFINDSNSLINTYRMDSAINVEKVNEFIERYNNDQIFLDMKSDNIFELPNYAPYEEVTEGKVVVTPSSTDKKQLNYFN